jgi:sugar phosphate isomerase/epimerase
MPVNLDRRSFMRQTAALTAGLSVTGIASTSLADHHGKKLYDISLAEWSINKQIRGAAEPAMTNLDFPAFTRSLGIDAVEYVNQLFMDKANDTRYLNDLKKRCNGEGIKSLLIMCDREGNLGDPDKHRRDEAVSNHYKWARAAKLLGCHSIRVNAASRGTWDEQVKLAADGLHRLSEYTDTLGLNCIVENHGGLSSHGRWLAEVMMKVNHPRCGTLPDFGNFVVSGRRTPDELSYDRYLGTDELMPFAKAVSAKAHSFDEAGNCIETDYLKMMKIVSIKHKYHGYVGIEYEGSDLDAKTGIIATKKLLENVRKQLSA